MRILAHRRRLAAGVLAVLAAFTITGCKDWQVAGYLHTMEHGTAEEKVAVDAAVQQWKDETAFLQAVAARRSTDCYGAIAKHWPAGSQSWARSIVNRESGNNPAAANPSSSARGCFQLMLSVHAGRFTKLGYSTSQWSNPDVNTLVALDLYRDAGTAPWRL